MTSLTSAWMTRVGAWFATVMIALLATSHARAESHAADHWNASRRAQAIPRDLVLDPRGYGYIRNVDGSLIPHGHNVPSDMPRGATAGDTTGPSITNMVPSSGAVIGASQTFSATVTDTSGVRSVSFVVRYPSGTEQSFAATASGSTYSTTLQGFTNGAWSWRVVAKDNVLKGGGNSATSASVSFTVDTSGGTPPPSSAIVSSAVWSDGGPVQTAAGRLYFEMPSNARRKTWVAYVCSATVITDPTDNDRSVIVTAAHCVYDDANKAFARKVLFIPNQAGGGSATDTNCANDPMGCWSPSFGVVDANYTSRTFPNNSQWDYAYYVVGLSGAHTQGQAVASDVLELAAGTLPISFSTPAYTSDATTDTADPAYTFALGYSYNQDPKFMYCAENMTTEGTVNWWLPNSGLTGGSSGGPWIQPMASGSGPIISVNSWGYTNSPGMAGPQLDRNTASTVMSFALCKSFAVAAQGDGNQGVAVNGSTVCP